MDLKAKTQDDEKEVNELIDPKAKPVISDSLNIAVTNLKPKEGFTVGLCGSLDGKLVMANSRYKVKRVRPNGTLVLKYIGRLK